MTVTGEPESPLPPEVDAASRSTRHREPAAVREVCPLMAAEAGAWRSAYAAREHRCQAVQPPAPLAISKQRQLCLQPSHSTCATFVAARVIVADTIPAAPGDGGAALWPTTLSTPLVLEPARRMDALPGASARGGGQALLIALMVLAFLVLAIARTQSPASVAGPTPGSSSGGAVAASPSPSVEAVSPTATAQPSASVEPSASPSAVPSPSVAPTPVATPRVTPRPTATPAAATRSYRVRSGDTLSSIAASHRTTVAVIARLNGISDPRLIRVGQVLRVP